MIGKAVCYRNILLVYEFISSLLVFKLRLFCYELKSKMVIIFLLTNSQWPNCGHVTCDQSCLIRFKTEKTQQLFLFASTFHQLVKLYESLKAPIVELRAYIAFFCCKKSLFSFRIHFNQIRYQIFPLTCYRRV